MLARRSAPLRLAGDDGRGWVTHLIKKIFSANPVDSNKKHINKSHTESDIALLLKDPNKFYR